MVMGDNNKKSKKKKKKERKRQVHLDHPHFNKNKVIFPTFYKMPLTSLKF